jgi:hypothetical protein
MSKSEILGYSNAHTDREHGECAHTRERSWSVRLLIDIQKYMCKVGQGLSWAVGTNGARYLSRRSGVDIYVFRVVVRPLFHNSMMSESALLGRNLRQVNP